MNWFKDKLWFKVVAVITAWLIDTVCWGMLLFLAFRFFKWLLGF